LLYTDKDYYCSLFGGIIFALIRAKKAINDFNNHGIRESELAKHLKL